MYSISKEFVDGICPGTEKMKKWEGSPFESLILKYIPAERGKMAEKLFSAILSENRIEHELMSDNSLGYDFLFPNGKKIELKYSCEGQKGGFTFDQVRVEDGRYDGIVFMFVYPDEVEFYYVDKDNIRRFRTSSQHSGQSNACVLNSTKQNMKQFRELGSGRLEEVIEKLVS